MNEIWGLQRKYEMSLWRDKIGLATYDMSIIGHIHVISTIVWYVHEERGI
jgi:hypothetical protein